MDTVAKRLQWARERHGKFVGRGGPTEAAREFGWPVSTYLGHENGDRTPSRPTAKKYAAAYRVRWEWLLENEGPPFAKVSGNVGPVEGYAGAGVEFVPFDENTDLGTAPLVVEPNTGILIVRGDSMYPRYYDGEYIYYSKETQNPEDLYGRECVIKLKSGSIYIKTLRKGSKKRLFNLESWNHPMIEDQAIEWAAPVTWRRG